MAFTFKHGDRPLDGYTVQRGVGRGGFGEVYYAVSDGGREVALKYLRDNPQVELRGISHCINLKSPHLVNIFDVRQNDEGEYFVIMEYVSGPSLRDILIAEPNGLGYQKAAFFVREIAKGLRYLHDRGIVHRDMKPGNVFYDDGYVKIGDYGLSKFISTSRHSAQTTSVGTVHYMAPEVGSGNYSRGIDVYALGVMLYEMLLGKVPYEGSSMGEVLMKHLTAQPELDELPAPFAEVIRKSLAKDPNERYQTVDEMVDALFIEDDVKNSVAGFNPSSLSQAVQRGTPELAASPNPTPGHGFGPPPPPPPPYAGVDQRVQQVGERIERKINRFMQHGTLTPEQLSAQRHEAPVPIDVRLRTGLLTFLVIGIVSGAVSVVMGCLTGGKDGFVISGFLLPAFVSAAILGTQILVKMLGEIAYPPWIQKLFIMALGGFAVFIGTAPLWDISRTENDAYAVAWALVAVLFFVDWHKRLRLGKIGKMSFATAIAPCFLAWIVWLIAAENLNARYEESGFLPILVTLAAMIIVQATGWFKPWIVAPQRSREGEPIRGYPYDSDHKTSQPTYGQTPGHTASPTPPPVPPQQSAPIGPQQPQATSHRSNPPVGIPLDGEHPDATMASHCPLPGKRWAISRAFWGVLAFLFFSSSVMAFFTLDTDMLVPHSRPVILVIGIVAVALCIYSLTKITERRRKGFWSETIRPLLICLCLVGIALPIAMDNANVFQSLGEAPMVGEGPVQVPGSWFLVMGRAMPIIFGVLLLVLVISLIRRPGHHHHPHSHSNQTKSKNHAVAIAFGIFAFLALIFCVAALFSVRSVTVHENNARAVAAKIEAQTRAIADQTNAIADQNRVRASYQDPSGVQGLHQQVKTNIDNMHQQIASDVASVHQKVATNQEINVMNQLLQQALNRYKLDFGHYPETSPGLEALMTPAEADSEPWKGPYLNPSGFRHYQPGPNGEFRVNGVRCSYENLGNDQYRLSLSPINQAASGSMKTSLRMGFMVVPPMILLAVLFFLVLIVLLVKKNRDNKAFVMAPPPPPDHPHKQDRDA